MMERIYDEDVCSCALNRIFGFKPKIAVALISALGHAADVFRLRRSELDRLLGPFSAEKEKIGPRILSEAASELDGLYAGGYSFTYYNAPEYPALLRECEDPPVGLYIRSISPANEIFNCRPAVAVVGTRDISGYGAEWCRKIAGDISRSVPAPVIVSGLALGTDIIAHNTALEYGAPTIAVMATGIDTVYPARHRHTADRIAGTPGCALITDYPPGTAPLQINFLRRNRIIAGLCSSTILVESKARGGGMLTARLAFSYSRDVYALPGRIDDTRSQGCNILIREKVAEAVISGKSLVESMGFIYSKESRTPVPEEAVILSYGEKYGQDKVGRLARVVLHIRKNRGTTIEEIADSTGYSYKEVLEYAALLESDGIICTDLLQRCYIRVK